ncbi:hypothetical protein ABE444_07910 [Brevundimonas pondensis]|uniref:hypothetical protein n=1 Tax=Brevundimonas pondensis TaxID=2774189 RepID=UPI0032084E06
MQRRQLISDGLYRQVLGLSGYKPFLTLDQSSYAVAFASGVGLGLLELIRVIDDSVRETINQSRQSLFRLAELPLELPEHLVGFRQARLAALGNGLDQPRGEAGH